jgi:hypothetical protein
VVGPFVQCGGVGADDVDEVAGPAFRRNERPTDARIFFFAIYE